MKSRPMNRMAIFLTATVFLLMITGNALMAADAKPAQEKPDWFFHDIVDVQFVMAQVATPMPENVMIIDARPAKPKYIQGHIPMAISIPDTHFDKMTDQLPKDKNALLIFYCGGPTCKLSHKSARKAEQLGYTNVKVFADGFPGWMKVAGNFPSVSAEWVKKQIDGETGVVLIDSRPKRTKYDKGHIPTAISIPDGQFDELKGQLPENTETPLVFYCGGFKCNLSHKSARKAMALGYKNVKVFTAGYPEWIAYAGTATAPVAAAPQVKAGQEEGSIDIQYFKTLVSDKPESIYLIDVRDADEYAAGSFKTAINIPVDNLEGKIAALPSDKPIVFVCGTGARSGESYYMVQDLRPSMKNVYYLDAELTFKKDGSFNITKPVS